MEKKHTKEEKPLAEDLINDQLADEQQDETLGADEGVNVAEDVAENWEEKYNELNNNHLRLLAEFDNYRKRTMKEKADLIRMGGERIFVEILPVVDDFERAIDTIAKTDNVEILKEGVDLIYSKFLNFLTKNNIKEINVLGDVFDTEKHEAITTIPAQEEDSKDKIIDCVQKGYTLDDKVIRFPKVIVAK